MVAADSAARSWTRTAAGRRSRPACQLGRRWRRWRWLSRAPAVARATTATAARHGAARPRTAIPPPRSRGYRISTAARRPRASVSQLAASRRARSCRPRGARPLQRRARWAGVQTQGGEDGRRSPHTPPRPPASPPPRPPPNSRPSPLATSEERTDATSSVRAANTIASGSRGPSHAHLRAVCLPRKSAGKETGRSALVGGVHPR